MWVPVWLAWPLGVFDLLGVVAVLYVAGAGLERVGDWWRFRGDVGDDYTDGAGGYAEPLEGLPEERSAGELGFTGPQPAYPSSLTAQAWEAGGPIGDRLFPEAWSPHRERWAPAWEAEARSAYQALDLDYPSGLLARIRAGQ